MTVTSVDGGRSSSRARSGVTPTPAPIKTTRFATRRCRVKVPYGPSIMTRVPGRKRATARLWSPRPLTVTRRKGVVEVLTASRDGRATRGPERENATGRTDPQRRPGAKSCDP